MFCFLSTLWNSYHLDVQSPGLILSQFLSFLAYLPPIFCPVFWETTSPQLYHSTLLSIFIVSHIFVVAFLWIFNGIFLFHRCSIYLSYFYWVGFLNIFLFPAYFCFSWIQLFVLIFLFVRCSPQVSDNPYYMLTAFQICFFPQLLEF